ncbi:MAG: DUF3685 domain-containing protein [Cyanobacteria bacterium]|nr:DUF3685 domain-containing protein [Cyanobacteriota bacterium]
MSQFELGRSSGRPIRCVLIEPDEARRWMLSFVLQNSIVWQIVAECEALELGLVRLDALRSTPDAAELVLLGSTNLNLDQLVPIVAAIGTVASEAKIVVLGALPASNSTATLLGADGYWWTGDRPESLLELLQTLRPIEGAMKPSRVVVSPAIAALGRLAGTSRRDGGLTRFTLYDRQLAQLDIQLRTRRLNRPMRWFLQGRIREIQAARWIAQQMISPTAIGPKRMPPRTPITSEVQRESRLVKPSSQSNLPNGSSVSKRRLGSSLIRSSNSSDRGLEIGTGIVRETALREMFDRLILKLEAARISPISRLDNLLPIALEIDVLTMEMQVALLTTIATVLQAEVGRLREIGLAALHDRIPVMLETVWEIVVIQFFRCESEPSSELSLVNGLQQSSARVNGLLKLIPLVADWVAYGLWGMPLSLDNQPYGVGTPQADDRALLLLENTVLRLANAVIQPLLNQFSDVEWVKAKYFKIQYASSRELMEFRNDLSWRYRRDRWLDTPKDIFESQYRLLYLAENGIGETVIYAPRQQELADLSGLPLAVTLVLETRDAISPRLRSVIALIGTGVVYVLTEVVGRGIGLVGQGIIKGIGNAWNDRR